MASVRWSVDPKATTRLRFDDPDFQAALEADAARESHPLATLIGGGIERATDADFSALVADGVYIDARLGITAGDEDQLQNHAQQDDARKGIRYDVDRYNRLWFAMWVAAVGADVEGAAPPRGLSSARRSDREEAVGALPAALRGLLFARLRAHVDAANRPAMRDPLPSRTIHAVGSEV